MRRSIQETIMNLEIVRQALCAYGAKVNETCDCKFGVKHCFATKDKIKKFPYLKKSEKGCGCPEIREAIRLLRPLVKVEKAYMRHVKDCGTCGTHDTFACREGNILSRRLFGYGSET